MTRLLSGGRRHLPVLVVKGLPHTWQQLGQLRQLGEMRETMGQREGGSLKVKWGFKSGNGVMASPETSRMVPCRAPAPASGSRLPHWSVRCSAPRPQPHP